MKLTSVTLPRITLSKIRTSYASICGNSQSDDTLTQAVLRLQSGGYFQLQNGGLILLSNNTNG